MAPSLTTFCSARTRRDLTCNRRAKWRCEGGHDVCGTHAVTGLCVACGAVLMTLAAGGTMTIATVIADVGEPLTT
jgi:hypothetical protein